jgi:two-component system chemotaxis sensor kinase CheA
VTADPYRYFRVEARELLEQLAKGILDLERQHAASEVVPRLLRVAHTLKGAARVVKQREVAELAHEVEGLLAPFRNAAGTLPRDLLDRTLKLVDAMGACAAQLAPPPAPGAGTQPAGEEPLRTLRADVSEMDALLDGLAEAHASLASLQPARANLERAQQLAGVISELSASPRAREAAALAHTRALADELRALLTGAERGLRGALERAERELRQARDAGERLRLVPASALFGSLERAARDVARALGRPAAFQATGADVRLDAHVLGALQAALIQLVRNAVAHGLEAAEERLRAGKPAEGVVSLDVVRRGSRVAFVCRDDGRGIDLQGLRSALELKGVLSADAPELPPEELLRLLAAAGVSTSGVLTQVSGRGVGFDVVRDAVSALAGEIIVRTRAGEGTTVELVVPVSLSSVDALQVEARAAVAALPLDAVRRTLRLTAGDVVGAAGAESVVYDGVLIPFLPLASALGPRDPPEPRTRAWSAVVLSSPEGGLAAVGVDRILGTANIVVRPLPPHARADSLVAGACFDAAGNPQLVLDPERLLAAVRSFERAAAPPPPPLVPILVVDDSLTTRMLEQSILESAGYEVDVASSGEEALQKARRRRYGLLLVDIEMPGMDGFMLLEQLRADTALRDVPAILVSSRSSPEDRVRGEQAGARAYMAKNEFDQGVLLDRIRSLLASR